MKKVVLLVLLSTCAWAVEVQKVVQLKYASPDALQRILMVFGLKTVPSPELNTISLAGPEEVVKVAMEEIRKLDVPSAGPRAVEITVYLVGAGSGSTPPELDGVIKQLRQTFNLKQFQLFDVVTVQMRTDRRNAEASGTATFGNEPSRYELKIQTATVGPVPQIVHLNGFQLKAGQANLQTDVDIKEGQKVVIGKTGLKGVEQPLFVVVSAKVLE